MARVQTLYWSSCCGALADYIGYYRCRHCEKPLNMGRAKEPHLISDPHEANRIQRERDEQEEAMAGGHLF